MTTRLWYLIVPYGTLWYLMVLYIHTISVETRSFLVLTEVLKTAPFEWEKCTLVLF